MFLRYEWTNLLPASLRALPHTHGRLRCFILVDLCVTYLLRCQAPYSFPEAMLYPNEFFQHVHQIYTYLHRSTRVSLVGNLCMSTNPAVVLLNSISCWSWLDHNGHWGVMFPGSDLIFGFPDLAISRKTPENDLMNVALLNDGPNLRSISV